jgi:hypothetical protein
MTSSYLKDVIISLNNIFPSKKLSIATLAAIFFNNPIDSTTSLVIPKSKLNILNKNYEVIDFLSLFGKDPSINRFI